MQAVLTRALDHESSCDDHERTKADDRLGESSSEASRARLGAVGAARSCGRLARGLSVSHSRANGAHPRDSRARGRRRVGRIGSVRDGNPIGASEARAVVVVDDKAAIAHEGLVVGVQRDVVVEVRCGEARDRGNVAMLTGKISHFARLGLARIARGVFAAVHWVEMAASRIAAAIRGDWVLVDVVHYM